MNESYDPKIWRLCRDGIWRKWRKSSIRPEEREKVIAYFRSHKENSDKAIAEALGMGVQRVSKILQEWFEGKKVTK